MQYYFAPMEGITSAIYRAAHHRWFGGVDKYYMPFLSPSRDHCFTRRELKEILPQYNRGTPAVPQLLTCRAEDFIWAAGALGDMGYGEVNLNLGCPSGTVTAKGKGAGFLDRLDELERFFDQVFSAGLEVDISIKTRMGMTREEEFLPLLALYRRYPISQLIVHARVRADFYKAPVRPRGFVQAVEQSRCPVCCNGDLFAPSDCARLEKELPRVEALMLGRGLIADPALARRAAGGPELDRDSLAAFLRQVYEGYAADFGSRRNAMLRMKEIWSYLGPRFDGGDKLLKQLKKTGDPAQYEALESRILRELEFMSLE